MTKHLRKLQKLQLKIKKNLQEEITDIKANYLSYKQHVTN